MNVEGHLSRMVSLIVADEDILALIYNFCWLPDIKDFRYRVVGKFALIFEA